jgi:hypothetical protein
MYLNILDVLKETDTRRRAMVSQLTKRRRAKQGEKKSYIAFMNPWPNSRFPA